MEGSSRGLFSDLILNLYGGLRESLKTSFKPAKGKDLQLIEHVMFHSLMSYRKSLNKFLSCLFHIFVQA